MKAGEKRCREIVRERSGGLCERCGMDGHTVHHRRKRSAGGQWTASNCVLLCGDGVRGCHGWVEHNPNDARAEGFHVRSFENEYETTVAILGRMAYLNDDGTMEEYD